ncbi:hypothetical protein [Streptosporangium sp. KLBMP 9127]|nr:hypothetical protein [Streptosporangium sp. KLBMP 9127]
MPENDYFDLDLQVVSQAVRHSDFALCSEKTGGTSNTCYILTICVHPTGAQGVNLCPDC